MRYFRTTIERLTKHLDPNVAKAVRCTHNSASADRRRVQVRRCTEFWPLPTGTPTPPEISVPFVFSVLFVLFVSASQYYFVEYP